MLTESDLPPRYRRRMKSLLETLLRPFLVGVVAVLPLVITVGVVLWVSNFLARWFGRDTSVGRAIKAVGGPLAQSETLAYLVGWILVLAVIFGLGIIVDMGARRFLVDRLDRTA